MKSLAILIFVLGTVFSLDGFMPRPARVQDSTYDVAEFDICVPDVGPVCVCRTCVYNDDGTCSCPALD